MNVALYWVAESCYDAYLKRNPFCARGWCRIDLTVKGVQRFLGAGVVGSFRACCRKIAARGRADEGML